MPAIQVTQNQLLNDTFRRQGLLERQPPDAIPGFGPLHNTDYGTPYLSLLARVADFEWTMLAERREAASIVHLRCMRGTLHLIPQPHVHTVTCAYRVGENEPFPEFKTYGITLDDATPLRFAIMETLEREGPQSTTSIKKFLPAKLVKETKNWRGEKTTMIGPVMRWMWQLGLLDSGVGVKDWRKKDDRYRISEADPIPCDRDAMDIALARWYFDLYAPSTQEDWIWWTGFPVGRARAAYQAIQGELVEVRVAGMAETLYAFPQQAEALQAAPDTTPVMARLLPYEDALLKAYKTTRYRFYDEEGLAEDIAFSKDGEAYPTLWMDGRIRGVWTWAKKTGEPMTIEPYEQIKRDFRRRLTPEVDRVQKFVQASHVWWPD